MLFAGSLSIGAPSSKVARGCAPVRPAVNVANLGPCPACDAALTTFKIKPFVLEALRAEHPHPKSALNLSKTLWPQASRDVQHSMKVRVSCTVHSLHVTVATHADLVPCATRVTDPRFAVNIHDRLSFVFLRHFTLHLANAVVYARTVESVHLTAEGASIVLRFPENARLQVNSLKGTVFNSIRKSPSTLWTSKEPIQPGFLHHHLPQ